MACAITDRDGKIVLLKRSISPQKGKWVMPGGYVDRGEKVEDAAIRETSEECGLNIRIRSLLGVYSYTGRIPVVVVFEGDYVSGELSPKDETSEALFFSKEEIPWEDLAFQSTKDALRDYFSLNADSG